MGQKNYADCISNLSQLGNKWGTVSTVVLASGALAYPDHNNEKELIATPKEIEYYKDLVAEFKVTTNANTADVNLTVGMATSNYELTGANALKLDSDYWTTKVINLTNASAETNYYTVTINANEIKGKFVYFKFQYSGDPVGTTSDPVVEVFLNLI